MNGFRPLTWKRHWKLRCTGLEVNQVVMNTLPLASFPVPPFTSLAVQKLGGVLGTRIRYKVRHGYISANIYTKTIRNVRTKLHSSIFPRCCKRQARTTKIASIEVVIQCVIKYRVTRNEGKTQANVNNHETQWQGEGRDPSHMPCSHNCNRSQGLDRQFFTIWPLTAQNSGVLTIDHNLWPLRCILCAANTVSWDGTFGSRRELKVL